MTIQTKALIAIAVILTAFASGRYSATHGQAPSVTTSQQTTTDTQVKVDKDTHKVSTTTDVKTKDGSEKVVTVVTEDTVTAINKTQDTVAKVQTVVTQPKFTKTHISLLAVTDIKSINKLSYGISLSREIIGPVTVGVFGLSNGVAGLSIGLNF
jgi:hypothetical protein